MALNGMQHTTNSKLPCSTRVECCHHLNYKQVFLSSTSTPPASWRLLSCQHQTNLKKKSFKQFAQRHTQKKK